MIKQSLFLFIAAATLTHADTIHQNPIIAEACPLLSHAQCHISGPFNPLELEVNTSQIITPPYVSQSHVQDNPPPPPAPEEEDLKETDYSPWTTPPQCFTNANLTSPICVFTDATFASGRGISIITTAERAYALLNKPAFTHPDLLSSVNINQNQNHTHSAPPYELRNIPGRGRGLIATRTLHRGDPIFASTPILLLDAAAYDLAPNETSFLTNLAIANLPTASRVQFWKLLGHSASSSSSSSSDPNPIESRITTNAFQVSINDVEHYALLPTTSMLNHDCRPNADYFFDSATLLTHHVHATRTIYPGEEITITYISNEKPRHKRRQMLKQNWGFECKCSACAAHPALTKESDERVMQIGMLKKRLRRWEERGGDDDENEDDEDDGEVRVTPAMADTLISLYEQERLWTGIGEAYRFAAQVYAAFGREWGAVRYARLAVEFGMLARGFYDEDVLLMKGLAADPRSFWGWGREVARTEEGSEAGRG
ncbi:SET domain-containing protein [Westerdykella ornata]|uniref:SET domain-containing protein n=1 Tax=Westerdykella ornata TaxID=318751 RepID=A0A6A6JT63_WESOR|nr:SET domain-containing protein [Westerdykella ornata]KAF2279762.1 SET domain-containing protein [Westerdykella ornata]